MLNRWISGLFVGLMAVVVLSLTYLLLFAPLRFSLQTLAGDDAGYYFKIARNVCLGHGFTFDGLDPNGGFNPLQTFLLIGVFKAVVPSLELIACYRVGVALSLVFLLLTIPLLKRLVWQVASKLGLSIPSTSALTFASIVFFVLFIMPKGNFGMDAPLTLFVTAAYLAVVASRGILVRSAIASAGAGLLLGLVFMARLDMLPFLVASYFTMFLVAVRTGLWISFLASLTATAAIAVPYFLWARWLFGGWMPVSAHIKSSFPTLDIATSLQTVFDTSVHQVDLAFYTLALFVSIGALLGFAAAVASPRRRELVLDSLKNGTNAVFVVLSLYVFARLTYMALFSRMDVQAGYVLPAFIYLLLCAVWLAARLKRNRVGETAALTVAYGILGSSILLLAAKGVTYWKRTSSIVPGGARDEAAMAERIRSIVPVEGIIYGGGGLPGVNAGFGILGFLADRKWINGDGVANTYDYQTVLAKGNLLDYLIEKRVTHITLFYPQSAAKPPTTLYAYSYPEGTNHQVDLSGETLLMRMLSIRGEGMDVCLFSFRRPKN